MVVAATFYPDRANRAIWELGVGLWELTACYDAPMLALRRLKQTTAAVGVAVTLLLAGTPRAQVASSSGETLSILVTNDDGVRAAGILAVAQALRSLGEITIAAPADNQSGKGHSITTTDPIFVDTITLQNGMPAFSLVTTPASCVKVAIGALMTRPPDLVVSGINHGYNLGMVTYVSGTVGAAREAALMGIPAIAASLAVEQTDYQPAAEVVRQVVEMVRKHGLEPGTLLNVNIPPGAAGAIKGIQLTRQSRQTGKERFEEQKSPRGRRLFWSVWNEPTGDAEGTDVWAVEHGYAAVAPLRVGEFDPQTYEKWRLAVTGK
jgi:5'-nucleotidase